MGISTYYFQIRSKYIAVMVGSLAVLAMGVVVTEVGGGTLVCCGEDMEKIE